MNDIDKIKIKINNLIKQKGNFTKEEMQDLMNEVFDVFHEIQNETIFDKLLGDYFTKKEIRTHLQELFLAYLNSPEADNMLDRQLKSFILSGLIKSVS